MNEIESQIKPINKKLIYETLKQDIINLSNIKSKFNETIKKNQLNPKLFIKGENSNFYKTNNIKNLALNIKQSKKHITSFEIIEKKIYKKFCKLYQTNIDFYNIKIINEIISNDNSHIVAEFKDFLIKDDYSEFIQKYYNQDEIIPLLKQIFEYYKLSSVVYPNYILLPENKYIYRNIQKKQKIIDDQQEQEENEINDDQKMINWTDRNKQLDKSDKVFDSKIIDSILNQSNTSQIKKFVFDLSNENSIDTEYNNLVNLVKNIDKAEENGYSKFIEKNKLINNNNLNNINNNNNNNTINIKKNNIKEEQNILNIGNDKNKNKGKQFINNNTNNSRNNQNCIDLMDFGKTHFNFSSNLINLKEINNRKKKFYSSYINKDNDNKTSSNRIKTPLNNNKKNITINYKNTNSINDKIKKNEHILKNNKDKLQNKNNKNILIENLSNEINSLNKIIKSDWNANINHNNLVKNNNIDIKKTKLINSKEKYNDNEKNKKKLLYVDKIPYLKSLEISKKKSTENNNKYIKKSVINELLSLGSSSKETWRGTKLTESQRELSHSINKTEREKKVIKYLNAPKSLNNNKNIRDIIISDTKNNKYINNTARTATTKKNKEISLDIDIINNRKNFIRNSNDVAKYSRNNLKNSIGNNAEMNSNRNTIGVSKDEENLVYLSKKPMNSNAKKENKYNSTNNNIKNKLVKNKNIKTNKKNEENSLNNILLLNNKKNYNSRNRTNIYNKNLTYAMINMKQFLNTNNSLNTNSNTNTNINHNYRKYSNNIINTKDIKLSQLKEIKDKLKLNIDYLKQSDDLYKKIETNRISLDTKKNNIEINLKDIKVINNNINKSKKQNRIYPLSAREFNLNNNITFNNNIKHFNRILPKSSKSKHKTLKNSLNEAGINNIIFGYSNSYKNKNKYIKKIQTNKMSNQNLILSNFINKKDEDDKNIIKKLRNSTVTEVNSIQKSKRNLNSFLNNNNNNSEINSLLITNFNNSLNSFPIKNRSRNINENNNLNGIKTVISVNYDENKKYKNNSNIINTPNIRKKMQKNIYNSNKKINNSINDKNTRYYNIEVNIHNDINNKIKNKDKLSINKVNNNISKQHIKLNSTQFSTGSLNINFNNYTNNFCVNYNNNNSILTTNQNKSKNTEYKCKYTQIESKNYKYKRIKNIKSNIKGLNTNKLDKLNVNKKTNFVPIPYTDRNKKINLFSPINNYSVNILNKNKK